MGSYSSSSKGGAGGGTNFTVQAHRIASPSTKQDFLDRANFIAEVSENGRYKYDVSTKDWQKNERDRTYIKLNEYYVHNGSLRQSIDMGYYDNVKGEYAADRTKTFNKMTGNVWDISGSEKFSESAIADYLKNKNKK